MDLDPVRTGLLRRSYLLFVRIDEKANDNPSLRRAAYLQKRNTEVTSVLLRSLAFPLLVRAFNIHLYRWRFAALFGRGHLEVNHLYDLTKQPQTRS
jgi:hypothetical protein